MINKINSIKQDIWLSEADLICIPTNSTLDKNGRLVMGAGLALQAKRRYPKLPQTTGQIIMPLCYIRKFPEYGLIRIRVSHNLEIGLLQTKTDWRLPSSEELILTSLQKLSFSIEQNNTKKVALPLLGAGCGGLSKARSRSLINQALGHIAGKIILCDK
jgi:O-acetyl-ADP-ribose deacetylase (regulator of RNase III)